VQLDDRGDGHALVKFVGVEALRAIRDEKNRVAEDKRRDKEGKRVAEEKKIKERLERGKLKPVGYEILITV
jgi:hypothetical protein